MQEEMYADGTVRIALRGHIVIRTINLLLGFFFQILVVKILAPLDFAAYAVLVAFLTTLQILGLLGIDRTILRFVPYYTIRKDLHSLRRLFARLIVFRILQILVFMLALVLAHQFIFKLLRVEWDPGLLISIGVLFFAMTVWADAEFLAQSWMLHVEAALIATFEISGRVAAILFVVFSQQGQIGFHIVVLITAVTCLMAAFLLVCRLVLFSMRLRKNASAQITEYRKDETILDVSHASAFAASTYVATLGSVLTSPLLVRVVGSTGLALIPLASFSFAQSLLFSLQRALPGMLVLPGLEPVLMAELAGANRSDRIFGTLSLLTKLEFIAICALAIVTTIAGSDIIRILAKPEYAQYYFALPLLLILFLFTVIYRVLEVVARMALNYRIFFILFPLGLLALLMTFLTAPTWGIWSVLLCPIFEIVIRIAMMLVLLRRDHIWASLDLSRSLSLILVTGTIIAIFVVVQRMCGVKLNSIEDYALAIAGLIAFGTILFFMKPMRRIESELLLGMLPSSWAGLDRILQLLTHREMKATIS